MRAEWRGHSLKLSCNHRWQRDVQLSDLCITRGSIDGRFYFALYLGACVSTEEERGRLQEIEVIARCGLHGARGVADPQQDHE